jgi:hypothetical protein
VVQRGAALDEKATTSDRTDSAPRPRQRHAAPGWPEYEEAPSWGFFSLHLHCQRR